MRSRAADTFRKTETIWSNRGLCERVARPVDGQIPAKNLAEWDLTDFLRLRPASFEAADETNSGREVENRLWRSGPALAIATSSAGAHLDDHEERCHSSVLFFLPQGRRSVIFFR